MAAVPQQGGACGRARAGHEAPPVGQRALLRRVGAGLGALRHRQSSTCSDTLCSPRTPGATTRRPNRGIAALCSGKRAPAERGAGPFPLRTSAAAPGCRPLLPGVIAAVGPGGDEPGGGAEARAGGSIEADGAVPDERGSAGTGEQRGAGDAPPERRRLTSKEREILGLKPKRAPPASPAQSGTAAPPAASSTAKPARSTAGKRGKGPSWTLLDELDAEGYGYMAPDPGEPGFVTQARKAGEWLIAKFGGEAPGDDQDTSTGSTLSLIGFLVLVVFPIWFVLVLVAVGKVDLPPALATFQATLRS